MLSYGDNKFVFVPSSVKRLISLSAKVEPASGKADAHTEWSVKCAKSVIRKLRDTPGANKELERILRCGDSEPTGCIRVARSLDGRVQVGEEKGPPHFMYCRLFRWPQLKTYHQLKAIDSCEFAFHQKKDQICINPYHYVLVVAPGTPFTRPS